MTCARVPVQLPAGSRSALGPSHDPKMCAAAQRRRPTCARPGAAAATCSRCWRCWPWPCGQLPVGVRCLEATPSWSTAAVPRRTSGAVAQPQCSQSCATAEPVQPEHVNSMLMHGWGRVVCQSYAVGYVIPTTGDHFDRTLYPLPLDPIQNAKITCDCPVHASRSGPNSWSLPMASAHQCM